MTKPLLVILTNSVQDEHQLWENACLRKVDFVDYKIVNLLDEEWIEKIQEEPSISYFLVKPPGITASLKQLFDERLIILNEATEIPQYPSLNEVLIYENKRYLSQWLRAHKIPHPITHIFYSQKKAIQFTLVASYPLVAKVNIGAAGSGVIIINNPKEAQSYLMNTFRGKGAKRRVGPNFEKSGVIKRGIHYILHPKDILKKIGIYQEVYRDRQRDFVIFQKYIPHSFEWRVVRIGDSFFAHKKIKNKNKASGALLKGYENPPLSILDFVKAITDRFHFYSQAIDIFETKEGYLVNEMQCIFGQSDPYQMLVDGVPGRYRYLDSDWIFEKGDFATNECFDLRMDYILDKING